MRLLKSPWFPLAPVAVLATIFFLNSVPPVIGTGKYLYQGDPEASKAVVEVTDNEGFFQTSTKNRIVEFYSPYCGHCISFKKKYVKVATEARTKYGYDNLEFYGVSCAGQPEVCQKFKIQSYPSVFAIPQGAEMDAKENVGTRLFSLGKIETALKSTLKEPAFVSGARELEQQEDLDVEEEEEEDVVDDDSVEGENDEDEVEEEVVKAGTAHISGDDSVNKEGDDDDEQEEVAETNAQPDSEPVSGPDSAEKRIDEANGGDDDGDGDEDDDASTDVDFKAWKKEAETADAIRPKAGADTAKGRIRDMDKWKEIQRQRLREKEYAWLRTGKAKPGSLGKEIIQPGGATKIMKANRRGTEEFNQRQKDLLTTLDRMDYRKHGSMIERMNKNQLGFKKVLPKPRIAEKIPVIKRVTRMSPEEQLILDASLSFREGLRVGVFKTLDPLDPKQKMALKSWLELMSISLPPEWGLHDLIGDLLLNIDVISRSSKKMNAIIAKHPFPRRKWSASCGKGNGFTCGFWKLLHIMTIGVAEHRGGRDLIDMEIVKPGTRVFSPIDAADTVREYMAFFFTCTECAAHFVGQYDDCDRNRRCSRLTSDSSTATDADWKELGKWLWEVHNDVNVRLLNQKFDDKLKKKQRAILFKAPAGPGGATMHDEVKALWPTIRSCVECINDDGTFNEDSVFLFLEKTYWPGHDLTDTPRRLIWFEDDGHGAIGLNSILLLVGLVIVFIMRNSVNKASVRHTMLKYKTMGTRVVQGGKSRTF